MSYGRGETVTHFVRSVTGRDSRGNDLVVFDAGTDIPGCPVWPRGSTEQLQHRDTVTTGLTTVVPPDTPVTALDRFQVRGDLYEVDGTPSDWRHPVTGRRPGLEVQLTRVTG